MHLVWKIWVDAKTEKKSLRLCARIRERMGREASDMRVEPYPKTGGFVVGFVVGLESTRWNDAVVEAIALGQRVGYGWVIAGSVRDEPSGCSDRVSISGVQSMEWSLVGRDDGGAG